MPLTLGNGETAGIVGRGLAASVRTGGAEGSKRPDGGGNCVGAIPARSMGRADPGSLPAKTTPFRAPTGAMATGAATGGMAIGLAGRIGGGPYRTGGCMAGEPGPFTGCAGRAMTGGADGGAVCMRGAGTGGLTAAGPDVCVCTRCAPAGAANAARSKAVAKAALPFLANFGAVGFFMAFRRARIRFATSVAAAVPASLQFVSAEQRPREKTISSLDRRGSRNHRVCPFPDAWPEDGGRNSTPFCRLAFMVACISSCASGTDWLKPAVVT